MIGPTLFGLDFRSCVLCIVFFTAISCIPPAYLATNGPKTGMRQMVQARFALGYVPALVFGMINCASFIGFLALTVILGGQSLSLASNSTMSWTVGIVIVAVISLLVGRYVVLGSILEMLKARCIEVVFRRIKSSPHIIPHFFPNRSHTLYRSHIYNGSRSSLRYIWHRQTGNQRNRKRYHGLRSESHRLYHKLF